MNTEIAVNENNIKSHPIGENGPVVVQDTHRKDIAGFTVKKEGKQQLLFQGLVTRL